MKNEVQKTLEEALNLIVWELMFMSEGHNTNLMNAEYNNRDLSTSESVEFKSANGNIDVMVRLWKRK